MLTNIAFNNYLLKKEKRRRNKVKRKANRKKECRHSLFVE
jgi:hypothetical protein